MGATSSKSNQSDSEAAKHHNDTAATAVSQTKPKTPDLGDQTSAILSNDHIAQLAQYLPPAHAQKWTLLYSSDHNGKSFNRLLTHVVSKGPSIVIIQEKDGNVFGGYAAADWRTPADRYEEARDERASIARAERTGGQMPELRNRPSNQHVAFYGPEQCFVWSLSGEAGEGGEISVYRARPSMNANYMYLFDTHALEDKVGVGMGGQAGYHAWFLDRYLDHGHCKGVTCTTFGNPRLSKEEVFEVVCVEVWGVDPAKAVPTGSGDNADFRQGAKKKTKAGEPGHVLDDEDNADKAIMKMQGKEFYSDNV
eukprot:PhF_6_TR26566/c0_g1_i1/m.38439